MDHDHEHGHQHADGSDCHCDDQVQAATPETVTDPICGMSVKTATAKHTAEHAGQTYYFCSASCRAKFIADPDKWTSSAQTPPAKAAPAMAPARHDHHAHHGYDHGQHHQVVAPGAATVKDVVCGMDVDPATAKYRAEHDDQSYYFCSAGCEAKFKADPEQYLAPITREAGAGKRAGRHDLHLPHAPSDQAGGPRLLPHLRYGARAGNAECRERP